MGMEALATKSKSAQLTRPMYIYHTYGASLLYNKTEVEWKYGSLEEWEWDCTCSPIHRHAKWIQTHATTVGLCSRQNVVRRRLYEGGEWCGEGCERGEGHVHVRYMHVHVLQSIVKTCK